MMDANLKAKWIDALRSGEYQQGRCQLRTSEEEFCCLGVVLDIQNARWDEGRAILGDRSVGSLDTPPSGLLGDLSEGDADTLIAMNDGTDGKRKHSFAEIADYIEQNL
jgi:hypothetical protein